MQHRAAVLTADLFFSSQLEGAAQQAGCQLSMVGTTDGLGELSQAGPLRMVVIDLAHPAAQDMTGLVTLMRNLENPPDLIVAYTQHVQIERLRTAREAGCDHVTTRGDILRSLRQLLTS
jgi:CheY-like chemotaxis protein